LETFSKLFEFGDISKELDVKVLGTILEALGRSIERDEDAVDTFFNLARHNVLVILFQMLIVLKEKVLTNYKNSEIDLLWRIFAFFNSSLGLKRVEKLLRNTGGLEKISQPGFWEPIYFSPKLNQCVKVFALWFSLRISRQHSFTEKFVENYIAIARVCKFIEQNVDIAQRILLSISQIILESEQREFFLKLLSEQPEKFVLIPESVVNEMKSDSVYGKARALVKCANCGVLEKSEKQFKKCSRCGFVFYCSKACQRNDWKNHKQICKEIRKQN